MSLILDALRKSAGDRQRGQAPTLASAVGLTPRRRMHPARVPVALALLAGTAGAGWWLAMDGADGPSLADGPAAPDRQDSVPAVASGEAGAPHTALAAAPGLAESLPELRPESVQLPQGDLEPALGEAQSRMAGGVVAAGGGAALPLPPGTVYTPEATQIAGTPEASAGALPDPATPAPPAPSPPSAAPTPVAPSAAMPAPPSATVPALPPAEILQTVDQLDYSVRRELPSLDVSMYVYHADPERRFLIVGGKRYPRTDGSGNRITRIDDKVDLLEIRADGAVLEFNGQRFLLPRGR